MREIVGDLFSISSKWDWICIPTNGNVMPRSGCAVMGRGMAFEARKRFPGIDKVLGALLAKSGNHVHSLGVYHEVNVFSFPTKDHWREKSSPRLIDQSCRELYTKWLDNKGTSTMRKLAGYQSIPTVFLPRVGCGLGKLDWDSVKLILERHLVEDEFVVVACP